MAEFFAGGLQFGLRVVDFLLRFRRGLRQCLVALRVCGGRGLRGRRLLGASICLLTGVLERLPDRFIGYAAVFLKKGQVRGLGCELLLNRKVTIPGDSFAQKADDLNRVGIGRGGLAGWSAGRLALRRGQERNKNKDESANDGLHVVRDLPRPARGCNLSSLAACGGPCRPKGQ